MIKGSKKKTHTQKHTHTNKKQNTKIKLAALLPTPGDSTFHRLLDTLRLLLGAPRLLLGLKALEGEAMATPPTPGFVKG